MPKQSRTWLGIDPGKNGALCLLNENNEVMFMDFKSGLYEICLFLAEHAPHITGACLEKVHSMPNQGVKSTFSFGENFGMWQGMLAFAGIGYDLVRPQLWMKDNGFNKPTKKDIYNTAKRLYPDASLEGARGGILDGRSDALMIAHYCRKVYG